MSTVFSKNKEKRSRSTSSESNNSFVKNVTSRVSGLLPTTITKWFSSPSSSANGSAPIADASDSSSEDEAPESPAVSQPPVKRIRLASPTTYNHYAAADVNKMSNVDAVETPSPYDSAHTRPARMQFRRGVISPPIRTHAQATWTEDGSIERSEKDNTTLVKSPLTVSTGVGGASSVGLKRKSLFDTPPNNTASIKACAKTASNTMRDPNQPCFKPSLLGSPFYPGRTTYGGASVSYINRPNIKQRKNAIVNETNPNENVSMSSSAKRILELLEDYSSPISEAKRIAQYMRSSHQYNQNASLDSSTANTTKSNPYKTQELHVPSIASILRLKQRSRLMDSTAAARQLLASHSSTADYLPYPASPAGREHPEKDSSTLTTKVKSRLTRPKRGDIGVETDLPAPVNLPSAVLQIDKNNLPEFSFNMPLPCSTPIASKSPSVFKITETKTQITQTKTTTTKVTDTILSKPDVVTINNYKFSSPVRISNDSTQSSTTPPKYTFGSPERSVEKVDAKTKAVDGISCVVGASKENSIVTSQPKSKDWECTACYVKNKPDIDECVCCENKRPPGNDTKKESNKCSVCKFASTQFGSDKCVNCEKVKGNSFSKPAAESSSKWKCGDCWVSNDDSAECCVCCGGKRAGGAAEKPEKKTKMKPKSPAANHVDGEWKCNDCWIKNKISAEQCVACGGPRPGSTPQPDPFKTIAKTQTEKWECASCLVRNDIARSKCACCETDRTGAPKQPEVKSFNFGVNTTFKFGIDPALQNSTPKPAEAKPTTEFKKPEESETNNNVIAKTPTFSFGTPIKKVDDQSVVPTQVEQKTETPPKISFPFGIPKPVNSTPASTADSVATVPSVFGTNAKLPQLVPKIVPEEKEKPQEVPKVDITVPKTRESPKPVMNMFSPPSSSQLGQQKPSTLTMLSTPVVIEKKEEAATSTPSFSFTPIAPAKNLFAAAPPATSAPFAAPIQVVPTTNSATTTTFPISIFQKSDSITAAPVSLFGKTETSTLTSATAATSASSLFSFGRQSTAPSAAPPAPQTDKPKFNFTFGSNNKTDAPQNVFMTPFGGAQNDTSNAAKFTMPTGTTLPSATTNALGTNGLPTSAIGSGGEVPSSIAGNGLSAPSGGMFGVPAKENMWSGGNAAPNPFVTNATSNAQKPAFTFGSSTTFSAQPAAAPAFGSTPATAPSVFGSPSLPSGGLFASAAPAQPAMFGSAPAAPAPVAMFGTPSVGATPAFGAPNASIPSFEAPSLPPAPAPAFNFGGVAQSTPLFGFGQPQPAAGANAGASAGGIAYNFGGNAAAPQFSMGSSPGMTPTIAARRMRKAVRRNSPR